MISQILNVTFSNLQYPKIKSFYKQKLKKRKRKRKKKKEETFTNISSHFISNKFPLITNSFKCSTAQHSTAQHSKTKHKKPRKEKETKIKFQTMQKQRERERKKRTFPPRWIFSTSMETNSFESAMASALSLSQSPSQAFSL